MLCLGASFQEILTPEDVERAQAADSIRADLAGKPNAQANATFINQNSPYVKAVEAIFSIGARLQFLLTENKALEKNFLVSPLSMAVVVGQLMLGARGKLRDYLADLLVINSQNLMTNTSSDEEIPLLNIHLQLGKLLNDLQHHEEVKNKYIMETASALFLEPGLALSPSFENGITEIYKTKIVEANFSKDPQGCYKLVNDWAVKNTGGRIKQILKEPLPTSSAAVLANAVYFKAEWQTPFSDELTAPGVFTIAPNKTVETTFLRGQLDASWADSPDLNCSILILPYKEKKVSMYLILPKVNNGTEYDLSAFTRRLRSKDLFRLIKLVQTRSVRVILPKINLSNTISLLDPLKQYENYKEELEKFPPLWDRFDEVNSTDPIDILDHKIDTYKEFTADNDTKPINIEVGQENVDPIDLSGASKDSRFKLTDIVQQISLAINEKGTEAAAISSSTISLSGGVKNFFANRPFLFFIRHEKTEALLFWGSIVNPNSNS